MKYQSITTSEIQHDAANAITELIVLNGDLLVGPYPWRKGQQHQRFWIKTVGVVKKLMGSPYNLTSDQLAFYVFRCAPKSIDSKEFAKMAVVAKKLLRRMDLGQLMDTYRDRRVRQMPSITEKIGPMTLPHGSATNLLELIRELEQDG
jgi:hypothetical protein